MAENLGMYQADISNLERAIGESGITDLFKLDMIADYFGISLVELLNGSSDYTKETVPQIKKTDGNTLLFVIICLSELDHIRRSFRKRCLSHLSAGLMGMVLLFSLAIVKLLVLYER